MRIFARTLAGFVAATMVTGLLGCGGGSGGGGATGGDTGSLAGRADQTSSRAPGDPITISVDGTDSTVTAGADGTFTLDKVPVGLHTVVASSSHGAAALVARILKNTQTNLGDVVLGDAGQVSGLVTSASTHQPVGGALVTVNQFTLDAAVDSQPRPVRVSRTNGQGSYTVAGLPVGAYLVNIGHDGFDTLSLSITIGAGTTTPGDAALKVSDPASKGSVSGTVTLVSADGTLAPLAGVLVRAAPRDIPLPMQPLPASAVAGGGATLQIFPLPPSPIKQPHDYYTFSDEKGAYAITGLPAGSYNVVGLRPGLDPDQKTVTVAAGATVNADLTLKPHVAQVGSLSGTVASSAGKPIKGATVTAFLAPPPLPIGGPGGGGIVPGNTGNTGNGGSGSSGSGTASPGSVSAAPPTVVGAPPFITPTDFVLSTTTDDQGHYGLKLPPGSRTITAYADGFLPKSAAVNVVVGSDTTANFALDPDPGVVALSGHVFAPDSNNKPAPVSGATVSAAGPIFDNPGILAPIFLNQTTTNDKGEYTLSVHTSKYSVFAYKDGLVSDPLTLAITQATTQDITLHQGPVPTVPPNGGPSGR